MEIRKIEENIYEIPASEGMKVPVRILASDILLNDMKKDISLKQMQNVAMLPGVLKNTIVLPDAHQGYGFCIGGVGAFDFEKGIISPGGVGYDINCLSGDTKILSDLGYNKKIRDFENNYSNESLNIFDKTNIQLQNSGILFFMKKHSKDIIKLKTQSGNEILATAEHPVYSKEGMKKVGEIIEGERILTYPFEGVEYEQPKKILLVSEKDIDKLSRSSTSKLQIKNKLKSLGLLPLYSDNPKIPYLLKIMGFIFGDGSITIRDKNCQIGFYGERNDLIFIKEDLKKIGFNSFLHTRKRNHKIETKYKYYEFERIENSLRSSSSSLAIFLNLLGTPVGNKGKQDYKIPRWIMNSVKWYKRLFLAGLFGAELSSPKTMTNHKFSLYGPVYSIVKKNPLHGIEFVNQIFIMLNEFGVRSVLLKYDKNEINGKVSNRLRLMVYPTSKNLINLFSKINYEYNLKKRKLANVAILWLKQKEEILRLRGEKMIEAREMKEAGIPKREIISTLSCKYVNNYFLEKSIYYSDYGRTGSRIAYCFLSFNEFVEENSYGEDGFVWDTVKDKEEKRHEDFVYDFTINNENHNFIANNFVVSNCSVRLLRTNLKRVDFEGKEKAISGELFEQVPVGVGRGGKLNLSQKDIKDVLENGAKWAVEKGYGKKRDCDFIEENGCMGDADFSCVSKKAISRGVGQLGSLGAGNHFLEVQVVDEIFDDKTARLFGLEKDEVCVMIHCGSRGLGHQVASDYIKLMEEEFGIENLPDRQLIYAPLKSELGKKYYKAMCCAANFAFCNKQVISHFVKEGLKKFFPEVEVGVVYDICHNIAKFEEHVVDGERKIICVHRKGAARSFGPGRKEVVKVYRDVGTPIFIPGSMGTSSYVLVGTKKAEELTFGSTAHGAGRVMSRHEANKKFTVEGVEKEMNEKNIVLNSRTRRGIVEESERVYKDVDEVVRVSDELGIGKKVARLKPFIVVRG
ncbi:MAG: RtcB family protein [Nanoarchaeota archaeon]|nr:RtcB family protein [Nanoarchaeota archaeon]